jgi:NAD(P)-dependent dehydrogenase (short-subunit alcohol dehydrogenase family)
METYKDIIANFCRNNAGALFGKFELSQDGLEKTFATNHMGEAFQTLMFVKVQQSGAEIISVGPFSPRSLQVLAS